MKIKNIKIIGFIILAIAFMVSGFFIAKYLDSRTAAPKDRMIKDQNTQTVIDVGLNEHGLSVNLKSAFFKLNKTNGYIEFNNNDIEYVDRFEVLDNSTMFTGYTKNLEGQRIEYIGINPMEFSEISEEEIVELLEHREKELKVIEKDNEIETDDYTVREYYTASSLFGEGYAIDYELTTIENKSSMEENRNFTSNRIKFNNSDNTDLILNIDGIGTVNIDKLSILNGHSGASYVSTYGILNIIDTSTIDPVIFISAMDNPNLNNNVFKLDRYKDYNNVYIDEYFDDNSDFGFGGFAIMTEYGMYYFKISEYLDNTSEIMDEILALFNIKADDDMIYTGYEDYIDMKYEDVQAMAEQMMQDEENGESGNTD